MGSEITIMSQNEADKVAEKIFGLILPTSARELKSAFRKQCLALHPDQNRQVNAEQAFNRLKKAYDALLKASEYGIGIFSDNRSSEVIDPSKAKTIDGQLLKDLGLGFGPTVNSVPCTKCDEKGYRELNWPLIHYTECSVCRGKRHLALHYENCRSCKGTGLYTQANSRRTVSCLTCKGSGKFSKPTPCFACMGLGHKETSKVGNLNFEVCYECKGKGQIKIFNPVLAKGRLV